MKLKILLLTLLMSAGLLSAQINTTLVISEARMDRADHCYIELTNMGSTDINLSEYEWGMLTPWNTLPDGWPIAPKVTNQWLMLPNVVLTPGESFVIAAVLDYTEEQYKIDEARFGYSQDWNEYVTKPEMWKLADMKIHKPEAAVSDPTDSITPSHQLTDTWGGRDVWYIRHHAPNGDSAVIDQVGGLFSDADGTNPDGGNQDVAGVTSATSQTVMVRRFDVKQGNTTFVRGIDLTDSEWIPIPFLGGQWEPNRAVFWTVGNHGAYNLDEATLTSSTIDIDWVNNKLTVPWGVRGDDSIMYQFNRVPGLAWHYDYAAVHEDSAFVSCRTGDVLTVYACGDDMDKIMFDIEVAAPTADANLVIPKRMLNNEGWYDGGAVPFEVTDGVPGMDTVREVAYATRVDTLFKYLEKAPLATWEIVWVDGNERVDVKNGDILRVTAENGTSVKDYFIKVQDYRKDRNAYLSAITWPDIPEMYKGLYGWMGDTIPSFNRSSYDYKVVLPAGVDKLPALVAKNEDDNARVEVTRAISLTGNAAQRTTTFTSYAENDTTILTYKVLMEKKKDPQPWAGEPFFSQIIWQEQWANAFMEIVNPGTAAIDLSNYMLFFGYNDNPASAIGSLSAAGDYNNRYGKYIPGYKWQTQAEWEVKPAIAVQDLNVNPIVQSGDVFVIGDIRSTGTSYGYYGAGNWPAENACDIDFGHNPWGETVNNWTALQQWNGVHYYLFKIVGDSIKEGLKPATDPNDFELIDTWGGVGTGQPTIGGLLLQQINGYVRKPQYYSGKTGLGESWGTDAATSEWVMTDRAYYNSIGVYWPADILRVADGLGSHFMYDVTVGKSTVASVLYKVSEGYTMDETILGAATGVTVEDFLANIYKEQENQTLIVKHDGTEITGTTVLANGDSLLVISADGSNMSRYFIEVTDGGSLSKDAVLTSTTYTVNVTGATGTVSNFDYGTTLKAVVAGVTVPAGANMTVVDENDAYIALTKLSFDTTYVDVLASDKMYFEVVAEDGATKILYQLVPNATSSDAFVISDVFTVDQETSLISSVPRGITVPAFLSNLTPATGASMVLKDKADYDRNEGVVVLDDKLVVTSQDGTTTKLYYLELQDVTGWLAYVLSSVYDVNQSGMLISGEGINNTITVSTFTGNLTPAAAATMEVQDALGAAKTSTQKLVENDVLQVTSGNGLNVVYYDIDVIMISVKDHMGNGISVYPNPTSGLVNVAGLEAGNHIKVYNSVGVLVNEYVAGSSVEEISMSNERSGLYFIIVSDDNNVKGTYKVILQ